MTEAIIDALMRLCAIITDIEEENRSGSGKALVESYLSENFNRELVEIYIALYEKYLGYYHHEKAELFIREDGSKRAYNRDVVKAITNEINKEFELKSKFLIVIQLLEFIKKEDRVTQDEVNFVDYVSAHLMIDPKVYNGVKTFSLHNPVDVKDRSQLLLIDGRENGIYEGVKHLRNENQGVEIFMLRIKIISSFIFRYSGPRNLYLNGHKVTQNRCGVFPFGGVLKTSRIAPIYYSQIVSQFILKKGQPKIRYFARDIEYKFSRKHWGLHKFSFSEQSGKLVGVMGGSGVGKSTLLNAMNGNLKLSGGVIKINGYNLETEKEELQGVIGYVPQDDMLIEELTVYQNLYFNARLCFGNFSEEDIREKIEEALSDFDLEEARDLIVGNPLKKILSGGQRKRLNIALELVREPSILFIDEPTSGLSSSDSEKVMNLLKRQTFKGKLVIVNIHQPSSDLYKLFDRMLIMDKGGYIIFNGNPTDAITYFKSEALYINPDESECLACGNVKTEQPLRIIEARMVNPYGRLIRQRKISPQEWYERYQDKIEPDQVRGIAGNMQKKHRIPSNFFSVPGILEQFKVFTTRGMMSKWANKQYMLITLLQAPVLALLLGYFSRFKAGTEADPNAYVFGDNINIPSYLFMSIVVALFMGLIQSAEEIFKDRKLLQRERFLNLSRLSFLSSKILMLFTLSAFQSIVYVLIGNTMLEIKGMTFSFWLILFSSSCFANALGLNLSSGLNSAITIYILIPLIIIPQLLFSGIVVDFNKMPSLSTPYKYTPYIGDLMTSRWAYESIIVHQFKNNEFNRDIFPSELDRQTVGFALHYKIPELNQIVGQCINAFNDSSRNTAKGLPVELIENELNELLVLSNKFGMKADGLHVEKSVVLHYEDCKEYKKLIDTLHTFLNARYTIFTEQKDSVVESLLSKHGGPEGLYALKMKYQNEAVKDYVENNRELQRSKTTDNQIIQIDKPIYKIPDHPFGRAHFYAPYKTFQGIKIDTIWFNMIIIWLFTAILLATLYFEWLKRVILKIEHFKLRRIRVLRQKID